jgi:hypothetical protein
MTKLSNYKSKTPEFQKLPEGENEVRLVSYKPTDSFHNYDGTLKDVLPAYTNPCEQLALTFVSTKGAGGMTHRINMEGYPRYSELSDEEIKSGKFTDVNGYACSVNKKSGKLERTPDKNRTAVCENILDQFFGAIGLPEGSGIDDLDIAIAEKTPLMVMVVNEPYEDKDQLRISRFKKAQSAVAIETEDINS